MQDAAIGIVFTENKSKVLLVKRRDLPVWVLPGGGIDPGESPETACVREVLEETGIEVEIVRKIAEYQASGRFTALTHVFECKPTGGQLQLSDESSDCGYFPHEKPPQIFLYVHALWIRDALKELPSLIIKPVEGMDLPSLIKEILKHPIVAFQFLWKKLISRAI